MQDSNTDKSVKCMFSDDSRKQCQFQLIYFYSHYGHILLLLWILGIFGCKMILILYGFHGTQLRPLIPLLLAFKVSQAAPKIYST